MSASNQTNTTDCKCCDSNEPMPIAPNNNIMTANKCELLISGYTRNNVDIELPPQDIIDSCVIWYLRRDIQSVKTYKEALDFVFKHHLCIKLFDFDSKIWRSAVYFNHWDKTQRIQFRFAQCVEHNYAKPSYITIKDFPVNFIIQNQKAILPSTRPVTTENTHVIRKWELNKLQSEQLKWKKSYQKIKRLESIDLLHRLFHSEAIQNRLYSMFLESESLKHCYKTLFTHWGLSKISVGRVLYHFIERRIEDLNCEISVN